MDCLIPTGWYGTGRKADVPCGACYVGQCGTTYVWVMPEGLEGLTRFTMTVLELATGRPHAPMKTVVRTYKSDGTLDNTQVTTTEIGTDALERIKKKTYRPDRPRAIEGTGPITPGPCSCRADVVGARSEAGLAPRFRNLGGGHRCMLPC